MAAPLGSWQHLRLDGQHGRQIMHDRRPTIAAVGRGVDLAAGGAEVDAAGIERVDRSGIAEDVDVTILLRQAASERFPVVAAAAATIDSELPLRRIVERVARDR